MSVAVAEVHDLPNTNEVSPQQQLVENLQEKHDFLFKRADEMHASLSGYPEKIEDEDTARRAADYAKQIGYVVKDLNSTRLAEKAPHDANSAAVQNLFATPIDTLKKDKKTVEDRLQVWQEAEAERKRKILEEETRRKREEAEAKRREEEAAAQKAREEAERIAREAREKAEAELRAIEEKRRQAEEEERQARERAAEAERKRQEAETARLKAEEDRRLAEEAAIAAERKRTEELKAAKEAQEVAERQRKEAEAERLKAERDRQAAILAREKAERERAEKEERAAVKIAEAEAKGERLVDKADARVAQATERETAAIVKETRVLEAKPHEFGNVKGEYGATATLRLDWDFQIQDLDALRAGIEPLLPHIDEDALKKAIRSFVSAGGRELAGVLIFQDVNTVVR